MTSPSSPPAFRLETSDRSQEDGAERDDGQPGGGAGPPPMESAFQPEDRMFSPQITVDLHYRKRAGASQPDPNRFDRDRLFRVVARGVPEDLAGLPEYLRRTSKYLTDTEYKEGSTGKTCLMKAVLNLRDGANACIQPLLQIDRDSGNPQPLVNAQCTDAYYRGHSALHIAIEKRSLPCVKLLVENGADVHARACGQFFQKKSRDTCFYFGELPLSLAVCTKQWDVVTYLLENPHQSASPQATDSLGNTALHALVAIADNSVKNTELVTLMYDKLLQAVARLYPTVRLEDIPNLQGLTPLQLAAKEGKIEIFRHILQREFPGPCQSLSRKFTEWSYGPVRVSLYDLASVDSWEENSVLEIIAFHCRSSDRHRMVVLEPLNKLLQEKWNLLTPRFLVNFLCYLMYVSIFTAVTYHQPALEKDLLTLGNSTLLLGHILILLTGAYLLMGQLWYFWRRRLFIWTSFMDSYFEILFLVQALLAVLSQVLCFLAVKWYLPLLVSSLVLGWLNLLYYTRGLQHTGIYSVMIQKVILRDLLRFLLVYLVFLFGFAVALVSLSREAQALGAPLGSNATETAGEGDKEGSEAPYKGILDASLELFKFTIGMGELAFQEQLRFRGVVLLLLLAYVLLTYVLLLNMLIALMSETVNSVASDSWSIWKLQKAISVLEMEKGYWWCRRKKQRAGVKLTVGTRPDGSPDERWCFRVEEVNWAAWEQTLPTVCEEPSGPPGSPGDTNQALASQPSQDSVTEEDNVPLQPLESR
ncbi:transient receptor potential cation channel subfamily V member 2 [Phacochoerus africanus]|uniref:transient receptor potential cation channel subfamily V member 2 n=1 Tax=Phacochoerus africanus TaxID=41426 RepID=UPI001FDA48EB|nr:transient receptor potential cation channel subfamily V member 2 [Phacochoerus africanus]XP_047615035.1 transient receptor potential cation channel subfamily V member 2 [Phacochoerus africanus]XP_047615036.1 transient receptor potential cation channel subfamily V member 2 [Phacochoerus africanus]